MTNGTISVQGRLYKKWASECFEDVLAIVEQSWKNIDKERGSLPIDNEIPVTSDAIIEEPVSPIIIRDNQEGKQTSTPRESSINPKDSNLTGAVHSKDRAYV